MSLTELQQDEARRRAEFPVAADWAYFAHAGVCPLPQAVRAAICGYAQRATLGDQEDAVAEAFIAQTRQLAAELLQCQREEIAWVGPTSLALSFIANGLAFGDGENILTYPDDYPSNVYPWMALARPGLEVRRLQVPELGRIEPEHVFAQVDGRTRLVALASAHFVAGWRIDLAAIGRELRQRGIWFCVDGIQTVGAFPTLVEHVDCLAADAHKWLLGPCAAGLLYVRRELQQTLRPTVFGWHNLRCPNFVAQDDLAFRADARRYEAGTANLLGLVGLRASLELLQQYGVEAIAEDLQRKRQRLVAGLLDRGYRVLQAAAPAGNCSGITSFWRDDIGSPALHDHLKETGIITSLRADRTGRQYIRVSPHFYNTDAELERLIQALPR